MFVEDELNYILFEKAFISDAYGGKLRTDSNVKFTVWCCLL